MFSILRMCLQVGYLFQLCLNHCILLCAWLPSRRVAVPGPRIELAPSGRPTLLQCQRRILQLLCRRRTPCILLFCFQNSYVNLRRKIPTLNEGTVKRWLADVGTKQWQNTKRYLPCVCLLLQLQSSVSPAAAAPHREKRFCVPLVVGLSET